jgi:mono/diheme cytochrome c family protein
LRIRAYLPTVSRQFALCLMMAIVLLSAVGCRQDMAEQPRYDPLEESDFFTDRRASRPLVTGTVARGQLRDDTHLYQGLVNGEVVDTFPFAIDEAVMQRGRDRYDAYCSMCHGRVGDGLGMVVQRGMRRPESFHIKRLREEKVGYFFDVITNGFGAMYGQAAQIPVRDRWAIIAYVRALQESQPLAPDDEPKNINDLAKEAATKPTTETEASPAEGEQK